MRSHNVVVTGVANSNPVVLNAFGLGTVALQVVVSGTITWTVQQTLDDPNNPPAIGVTWFPHPDTNLVAQTASAQGNYGYAPQAVRIVGTAGSGTATLTVIQSGLTNN